MRGNALQGHQHVIKTCERAVGRAVQFGVTPGVCGQRTDQKE